MSAVSKMGKKSPNATQERMKNMKRTLSLILALAMIMSLFTTVSFAAAGDSASNPADPKTTVSKVTYKNGTVYPVKYNDNGTATLYYIGTKPDLDADDFYLNENNAGVYNVNYASDKVTYYELAENDVERYYAIAINKANISLELRKAVTGNNVWSNIDANNYYYTGATVDNSNFYAVSKTPGVEVNTTYAGGVMKVTDVDVEGTKVTGGSNWNPDYAAYKATANTYYYSPGVTLNIPGSLELKQDDIADIKALLNSTDAFGYYDSTVDAIDYYEGSIRCKDATGVSGTTAQITLKKTEGDALSVIVPLKLSKASSDVTIDIVNGNWNDYTGKADTGILAAIENKIKQNVTAVTLTALDDEDSIYFYKHEKSGASNGDVLAKNESYTLDAEGDKFSVKTAAGVIGDRKMSYVTTVGGMTYAGTITFKTVFDTTKTDTQYAPFAKEHFYLESISGIEYLDDRTTATSFNSSYAIAKYYDTYTVNPAGHTANWTEKYVGYTSGKVAKEVAVTFVPTDYDILVYAEDGNYPFDMDMFEKFAEDVEAEQGKYWDISVDHIEFPTTSSSKKWALMKSGKQISKSDEFTSSSLGSVYIDVSTAGFYDIPFNVYYDYQTDKNGTWYTNKTAAYYEGIIRVYAGDDGDIKYEVGYGETINFKSSDFAALYKKMAGSKKVLDTVKIEGLPIYGGLYFNNKATSAYEVEEGDTFYFDPSNANSSYDLDKVLYWASKSSTDAYSVYIPVTMDGNGGEEVAVVEIVVNSGIPFTDVAKNSTFYDYIRYCYNNDIMGGKTATRFDATSSITRAQLVTTLYRMAGSPTTYNNKALPFTDAAALSNKEFVNAIKWAYYNKIVGGVTSTSFAPNTAVTRQALVKILYGYATAYDLDYGMVIGSNLGYYTDGATVSASMKEAMNWALDYGLLGGNGGKLNPKGSTTRGAAAKILANFHANFVG